MAHRGSRGVIALHFHDHGTRRRWGFSVTPRPLFAPRKYASTRCGVLLLTLKATPVQAPSLCAVCTAHRGSRGVIALHFHDHGTRRGGGVSVTPRPLFAPRKDPVPIVQEAGWAPGPAWTGAENLAPTRIRYPDLPARSQLLYGMNYSANYC